jgi:hypothetical protein
MGGKRKGRSSDGRTNAVPGAAVAVETERNALGMKGLGTLAARRRYSTYLTLVREGRRRRHRAQGMTALRDPDGPARFLEVGQQRHREDRRREGTGKSSGVLRALMFGGGRDGMGVGWGDVPAATGEVHRLRVPLPGVRGGTRLLGTRVCISASNRMQVEHPGGLLEVTVTAAAVHLVLVCREAGLQGQRESSVRCHMAAPVTAKRLRPPPPPNGWSTRSLGSARPRSPGCHAAFSIPHWLRALLSKSWPFNSCPKGPQGLVVLCR